MNSMIYQISITPFKDTEGFFEQDKYFDNFVGEIADRVSEIDSDVRNECIEELKNKLLNTGAFIRIGQGGLRLDDQRKYFQPVYDKYIAALKKAMDAGYNDFCDPFGNNAFYDVKSAWADKFGVYLDDGDYNFGLKPLTDAIRYMPEGYNIFFGNVFSYHY